MSTQAHGRHGNYCPPIKISPRMSLAFIEMRINFRQQFSPIYISSSLSSSGRSAPELDSQRRLGESAGCAAMRT